MKPIKPIIVYVALSVLFSTRIAAADFPFLNGDLREAKNRAAHEGKLIFLDFWASYCTPCKMMDDRTFTDPSVIAYVKANYIAVKVDIQSYEGYDLKNLFGIQYLPTILILNSKGVVLGKHEEAMSASRFKTVLQQYNQANNRIAYNKHQSYNPTTGYSNHQNNAVVQPDNSRKQPIKNPPPVAVAKATPPSVTAPIPGSKRATIPTDKQFTIQLGAYTSPDNLQTLAHTIQARTTDEKVFVAKKTESGRVIYRLLFGSFATRHEAEVFIKKYRLKGSYVRSFTSF
jgi:thioredoxin 1